MFSLLPHQLAPPLHPAPEQPADRRLAPAQLAGAVLDRQTEQVVQLHRPALVVRQPGQGLRQPEQLLVAPGARWARTGPPPATPPGAPRKRPGPPPASAPGPRPGPRP